MGKMLEIRWHGRGGQGAKTAATFVAAAALHEGKYSQGYPDYGPERMGAPMRGFTRVSDAPIRMHSEINHPDVVVVLDDTLLGSVPLTDGLGEKGILLVNTKASPAEVRAKLNFKIGTVYAIDASKIALETLKRDIPNTPMIGALIRATCCLQIDTVYKDIHEKFGKKFRADVVQGNLDAVRRAYEEVKAE